MHVVKWRKVLLMARVFGWMIIIKLLEYSPANIGNCLNLS